MALYWELYFWILASCVLYFCHLIKQNVADYPKILFYFKNFSQIGVFVVFAWVCLGAYSIIAMVSPHFK